MSTEIITKKQCIAIMATYIMGSAMVLGVGGEAKRDAWIAILVAAVMVVPILFVYARLLSLFPGKGLYEILSIIFGKIMSIVFSIPFIWFAFHLGALVIRNFTEFIKVVTLIRTPQYIIASFVILLSIWAVKAGIEVIGRWTAIVFPIIITAIIVVTLLFIPNIKIENLKPILYNGYKPVLNAALSTYSFPFAETVLFMVVFSNIKNNISPYKVYYISLLIGGAIILLVTLRSLVVLGAANTSIMYFASYSSVRLINIGDFLERIEISVAIVFMLAGFVKVCFCLYAASKGFAMVFNFNNYRQIVAPIGLLMVIFSLIIYSNTREIFEWAEEIYKFYAIPFETILPLIIWIAAEIKVHRSKIKPSAKTT